MTNHWTDIKNADVILIMGSNAAENHPVAFKWVMEAKEKRGATIISVDPRFTRSSSKADIYAPLRSGTDIVFLGGMINYAISRGKINTRYLQDCTNALYLVHPDFQTCRAGGHPGLFSGWDGTKYETTSWDYQYEPNYQPDPSKPAVRVPKKAANLNDPACVFQKLREQYSVYTPEMVERICGTPRALFQQICELYCNTYPDHLSATQLYAMGWTQHTKGSQIIRTASILQLLLGNVGVAGGGINALRGWHNVQGSTDHGVLFHLLPGYNASPQNLSKHADLGAGPLDTVDTYLKDQIPLALDPDPINPPASGNWWANRSKYVVSMLKAWWPSVPKDQSYNYLPKRHKDLSHLSLFEDMSMGLIQGLFVWGSNPAVTGPNSGRESAALDKLDWMVVCDLFETETAAFWKRPGVNPGAVGTEVFLLPGAAFYEKTGSVTNSGRLAQWKEKACEPPGDACDELEILADLGDAIKGLYSGSNLNEDKPIRDLNWPYDPRLSANLAEGVAKEIHGYLLSTGEPVTNFTSLREDETTACGNWLYSGTWSGGVNQMVKRDPRDLGTGGVIHPAGIGIYSQWGYSWPLNRRIVYNRASVYQTGSNEGIPLAPEKWVVKWVWDAANAKGGYYQAGGDVVDGYALDRPSAYSPFIMRNDGVGRLMAVKALAEGPFPEHYEPKETPLTSNPLTGGAGPLVNPCVYVYAGTALAEPGNVRYPIVATTFRLSEHMHGGGLTRNLPWLSQLMPEPFVEMSEELAQLKGIRNGDNVIVSSARGNITVKGCVTRRLRPFTVNGRLVHQVGLPWHWGFAGLSPGASANVLTPHIGDANTRIPEYKAFLVNITKA
jgi:formate dehydrogenase major subunit